MSAVLVIEDDDRIRLALALALADEGCSVRTAASAEDGPHEHRSAPADTVLVDQMLPGMDGIACIRALRAGCDVPIVVVSARSGTTDIVTSLEAGADDYLVKPVATRELPARLRALRRRTRAAVPPAGRTITVGELDIVHIARLRQKVEDDRGTLRRVVTVRGAGYKLHR